MENIRNTGVKNTQTLQLVYVSDGTPVIDKRTGKITTKPNKQFLSNGQPDPDYVPPVIDYCDCPTIDSPVCEEDNTICGLDGIEFLLTDSRIVGNNFTFVVGVNQTDVVYQFKNPISGNWHSATIGKNKTSYAVPANGQTVTISVRKPDCEEERSIIISVPTHGGNVNMSTIITGYLQN